MRVVKGGVIMRGKARHRIAYDGRFYNAGEILTIADQDVQELSRYCDLIADDTEREPEKRRVGRAKKDAAD